MKCLQQVNKRISFGVWTQNGEESTLEAGRFTGKGLQTNGGLGLRRDRSCHDKRYLPASKWLILTHLPSIPCRPQNKIPSPPGTKEVKAFILAPFLQLLLLTLTLTVLYSP